MNLLEFISGLISSLSWPLAIVVVLLLFRKGLTAQLPNLTKLRIRDFEIEFNKELRKIRSEDDAEAAEKLSPSEAQPLLHNVKEDPITAVIRAWQAIEKAAKEKASLLVRKQSDKDKFFDLIREIEYGRILSPSSTNILRGLHQLRSKIIHESDVKITPKNATQYVKLAALILRQIESIVELPTIRLTALTYLILELNQLLDTGHYFHISIDEIKNQIEKCTVLRYLSDVAKDDIDLSIFLESNTYNQFESRYSQQLKDLLIAYGGNERRKWGIENYGICLLIAWTNEIIQRGSGWFPSV